MYIGMLTLSQCLTSKYEDIGVYQSRHTCLIEIKKMLGLFVKAK